MSAADLHHALVVNRIFREMEESKLPWSARVSRHYSGCLHRSMSSCTWRPNHWKYSKS